MKSIDFIPYWYRERLRARRVRKHRFGYLCLLGFMMFTWLLLHEGQISRAGAVSNSMYDQYEQALLVNQKLDELIKKRDALLERKHRYDDVTARVPVEAVLSELTYYMPADVRLVGLHLEKMPVEKKASQTPRNAAGLEYDNRKYCDLELHVTAQSTDSRSISNFILDLQEKAQLFVMGDQRPPQWMPLASQKVYQKEFSVFIYSPEHIGP